MKKITVLITEDHTLVRQSLALIFNSDPRFDVIALCGSGEDAVNAVEKLQPDIVIMDINLPGISGFEATRLIRISSPATKILGLTMHTNPDCALQMIKTGVMGYVCKHSSCEELLVAVMEIYNNRKYICREIKNNLSVKLLEKDYLTTKRAVLTNREVTIIGFIKEGFTSKEIAKTINLTQKTVEVHRHNILKKLKLPNSAALINYVNQTQLVKD
jgi:two-component system invasion response regulator UvrY